MRQRPDEPSRRVCFVTGTRAEFGLMRPALAAIQANPRLKLQLIVTGMHLDPAHGNGLETIRRQGWDVDKVVPWKSSSGHDRKTTARNTGLAIASLADAFAELQSEIVLVVGDRVEAFAAASAAHIGGQVVAHVHGGDRAAGQVDDSLRHAISKLAHVHFPATRQSAARLHHLGEDRWRIHLSGSPGVDGIAREAAPASEIQDQFPDLSPRRFALLVLHPVDADQALEATRAKLVLNAVTRVPFERIVIVYPNNDPGASGIMKCWDAVSDSRCLLERDVPRPMFLSLMRDAAVLVGNSSSGIIEAASFNTPVIDIGPRQKGREHGGNVTHVPYNLTRICKELERVWNDGHPRRLRAGNTVYGRDGAGRKIAGTLARLAINDRLLRKLIRY